MAVQRIFIMVSSKHPNMENILSVLKRADAIDWREGMVAYQNYQKVMLALGEFYGYSLETTAAVFCELSPSNDYVGNLRSAATLMKGHREGVPASHCVATTFGHCKHRAWKYLEGERWKPKKQGPKISNFYVNITRPEDQSAITIDGHMVSVWKGKRFTMRQAIEAEWNYEQLAFDFRSAAFTQFILPSQLQAILWFTWKRVNKIIFKPQLSLLYGEDQWRLIRSPEEIEPWPFRRDADLNGSLTEERMIHHARPFETPKQFPLY
jgi:hypothetical protein